MFGIRILTNKKFEAVQYSAKEEGRYEGMQEIIEILRNKDKIILEPMTLVGDYQTVKNCAFINAGLRIDRKDSQ